MPFVAAYFNELDFSSTLTSLSCHSARRACPELQNPHFKKRRKTLSLGRRYPPGRMRGGGKSSSPALTHRLRRSPLSLGARFFLDDGFCDFAFSFAQNDRVVWGAGKSISFRTRETNRKEVWCCVHCYWVDAVKIVFGLMPCASVLDWCYVNWFWIDAMYIGFLLIHVFSIEQEWFISCRL